MDVRPRPVIPAKRDEAEAVCNLEGVNFLLCPCEAEEEEVFRS